jgi:hypothetical protein
MRSFTAPSRARTRGCVSPTCDSRWGRRPKPGTSGRRMNGPAVAHKSTSSRYHLRLPSEPGPRARENVALHFELAFSRRRRLSSWRSAGGLVPVGLRHPVANRLCRRLEVPRQPLGIVDSFHTNPRVSTKPGQQASHGLAEGYVGDVVRLEAATSLPGRNQDLASKRAANRASSSHVRARREDRAPACRSRARMHWRWRQPSVPAMPRRILEIFRLVG